MGWIRDLFVGEQTSGAAMEQEPSGPRFSLEAPPEITGYAVAMGIAPRISRNEALQVPAVLRARNLICTPATLPLRYHAPDRSVKEWSLFEQIDPDVPNSVVWAQTYEDLLFEGIAWWKVTDFQWNGYPKSASHIPVGSVHVAGVRGVPSEVQIGPDQPFPVDGQVFIDGLPVSDREVIRFDSPNPPLLKHAARAIRTCLKLDMAAGLYSDNPVPLGVFTPDEGTEPLEKSEIEDILDEWDQARSHRQWGYVQGMTPHALQWNPDQLQLADQRQHAVLEIARACGIDPEDLGVSTTSRTYQNAEQRRIDLLDFTLGPWVSAVQDRLSMGDVTPRGYKARVDFAGFLRGDTKTRYEAHEIGLRINAITTEELRELENRPALTSAGASDGSQTAAELAALVQKVYLGTPDNTVISQREARAILNLAGARLDLNAGEIKAPAPDERKPARKMTSDSPAAAFAADSPDKKRAAARTIVRLYRSDLDEEPPEPLLQLAGMIASDDGGALLSFDDPEAYATFRANETKRTISGLIVPWGKVAVSRGSRWRFSENSLRWGDASRIKLNLGHDRKQSVGYAAAMRNTSQGLDATFKIARIPEGDRALVLAADKVWDGLSIEIDFEDEFGDDWQPDPTDRTVRLVRQALLTHVGLTPAPAFGDARVAAVAASKERKQEPFDGRQQDGDHGRQRSGPRVLVRSRRLH